jgi:hypothetical protein
VARKLVSFIFYGNQKIYQVVKFNRSAVGGHGSSHDDVQIPHPLNSSGD